MNHLSPILLLSLLVLLPHCGSESDPGTETPSPVAITEKLELAASLLRPGDTVCLVGNALAERMQHHGWLETELQVRLPDHELSFRNLGFSADSLTIRQRTSGFGSPDEHLTRCGADVVFAFFGYNESFAGPDGIDEFKGQLEEFIRHTREQKYNGESAPRLVLFSPVAHEDHQDPDLPDGKSDNERIELYVRAMNEVAREQGVPFFDLFFPTGRAIYRIADEPRTINGIHLTEHGNRMLAKTLASALGARRSPESIPVDLEKVRAAVLEKNRLWFNRYRATDGYNVYGGRSSLKYADEVSNFTVLQRELEILDVMCANRDVRIRALARGEDVAVDDSNLPPAMEVKTNKPGSLEGGKHEFPSGEEAISFMEVAEGMKVELYADEARFPELVNPAQMAWDTRGRLWIAAWPTYPHWAPHQEMNDKLLILEDEDGDGRADVCKAFADDLHNPTGFEFWNGGVLVAQPPDILFLKDTDGDDRVDVRERLIHGLSSADTHHAANSFVLGPDGALYFQEGVFHQSQVESIYGPIRNHNACVWRFEPRTFRVERFIPYNFANPHGHVFDRWGQNFVTDGTGNQNYYALGFSGHIEHPAKHTGYFTYFKQRSRPAAATEILSSDHFPPENQGNLLIADVIQFQGILQYRFTDSGSAFGAEEVEAIVRSGHPTFRPVDIEMGPDGALYFADWTNPLIGHMQHHLRDPSRDQKHGRVYRVTVEGRPLQKPVAVAGEPIEKLLDLLKSGDDRVRYRTRIELSGREERAVLAATKSWVAGLDPGDAEHEHHLLEALWVHQQFNEVDRELLERVLRSEDPRARTAATRVVRGMRHRIDDALALLKTRAGDDHPRVRLEAVVAASFFPDPEAAVVALESLRHPGDRTLDYALGQTMKTLEPIWKRAIREGRDLVGGNAEGAAYLLDRVTSEELVHLPRSPAVYRALLARHGVEVSYRNEAAEALARANGTTPIGELLAAVARIEWTSTPHAAHVIQDLGVTVFARMSVGEKPEREELLRLARHEAGGPGRQLGFALLISRDGSAEEAWTIARTSLESLRDLLDGVRLIPDEGLRDSLFAEIRPLMFRVPDDLQPGWKGPVSRLPGLQVAYYSPNPDNVALTVFEGLEPATTGIVPTFSLDIPQVLEPDGYALVFRGTLHVPRDGRYTFFTNSDDGSRLYIDDVEVVDNDGLHGMKETSGTIELPAGPHAIVVTFYENGGGEGLVVSWQGPDLEKQPIPSEVLSRDAAGAVRDAAVRAMAHLPGRAEGKFRDAMLLVGEGAFVDGAVALIERVPEPEWPADRIRPLVDSIAAYVGDLPAEARTLPQALAALDLGRRLAKALPDAEAEEVRSLLQGLGGTIVLLRTVPHEMLYDVTSFQVEAGKPVAIVLQNNDMMPHNLVVTRTGRLAAVGQAAEKLAAGPEGKNRENFIPDTDDVLHFSSLLLPGQSERISFVAPETVGDYPYVCTFPGHWTRMNGIMKVVEKVEGDTVLTRTRADVSQVVVRKYVKAWTVADLATDARQLDGRSTARGKEMFTVAGCVKCHPHDGKENAGPDLSKITEKFRGADLLRQLIEPSAEIHEDYVFYHFTRDDGSGEYGRVVHEDGETLRVAADLLAPEKTVTISRDELRERQASEISAMPTGLLVTLTREEILDLLAYLESGMR